MMMRVFGQRDNAFGLCQCADCVELRRSGYVMFPPSDMVSMTSVMEDMRAGLREWASKIKQERHMKRHEAIEAVVKASGNQDMVEASASAERLVNALVRLGLLKFDEPSEVIREKMAEEDRANRDMRDALNKLRVPRTRGSLAAAAEALEGVPVACDGEGRLQRGGEAAIILWLVGKGFTITAP